LSPTFSFYYFLKDFETAERLLKKINATYSKNFVVQIEASENIENNIVNNIVKKYFNILKEFDITSSSLRMYSLNKKDLEENIKSYKEIHFIVNEHWKPTIGFSDNSDTKERLNFFQKCIAVLGVNVEVKEGVGDFGNMGLRIFLKPDEKGVTLEVMSSDPVGDITAMFTPISHKLEDAIQLFDKLVQKNLFPIRSYTFLSKVK